MTMILFTRISTQDCHCLLMMEFDYRIEEAKLNVRMSNWAQYEKIKPTTNEILTPFFKSKFWICLNMQSKTAIFSQLLYGVRQNTHTYLENITQWRQSQG